MKWYRRLFFLFWRQARIYFGPSGLPEFWSSAVLSILAAMSLMAVSRVLEVVFSIGPIVDGTRLEQVGALLGFLVFVHLYLLGRYSVAQRIAVEFEVETSLLLSRASAAFYIAATLIFFSAVVPP